MVPRDLFYYLVSIYLYYFFVKSIYTKHNCRYKKEFEVYAAAMQVVEFGIQCKVHRSDSVGGFVHLTRIFLQSSNDARGYFFTSYLYV